MGTETTTAVTTRAQSLPADTFGADMRLTSLRSAVEFAEIVAKSGLAPKGMNPEAIVIAMQMGYEVGLSPLQAIQNIASINGRPAIWGDACLALIRASGHLESITEVETGKPGADDWGYTCTVKRAGYAEASETFTVADAKRAGLWGKPGPWTQYPRRMLRFRARGFILRDQFGDVLKGLRTAEEAMDEPINVTDMGSDAPAEPKPAKPTAGARLAAKMAEAKADPKPEPAPTEPAPAETVPSDPEPAKVPFRLASALAATAGAGIERTDLLLWLVSRGTLNDGQKLEDMPQNVIDYLAEHPAKAADAVKAWKAQPF